MPGPGAIAGEKSVAATRRSQPQLRADRGWLDLRRVPCVCRAEAYAHRALRSKRLPDVIHAALERLAKGSRMRLISRTHVHIDFDAAATGPVQRRAGRSAPRRPVLVQLR